MATKSKFKGSRSLTRQAMYKDDVKGFIKAVKQTGIAYTDFTDGGGAAGTLVLDDAIPADCLVVGVKAEVTTGFTGDTSMALTVGDGSTADLFGVTCSILAAATVGVSAKYVSNKSLPFVDAATNITLTATGAADWGNVSAGVMNVWVYYIELCD